MKTNNLYNIEQLETDIQTVMDIKERLNNIVYMPQEAQKEHFDKLQKSEQVALIGIFNDSIDLYKSLCTYKHWFKDE